MRMAFRSLFSRARAHSGDHPRVIQCDCDTWRLSKTFEFFLPSFRPLFLKEKEKVHHVFFFFALAGRAVRK